MCELNCVTLCQVLQHFGLEEGQMQLKCVMLYNSWLGAKCIFHQHRVRKAYSQTEVQLFCKVYTDKCVWSALTVHSLVKHTTALCSDLCLRIIVYHYLV